MDVLIPDGANSAVIIPLSPFLRHISHARLSAEASGFKLVKSARGRHSWTTRRASSSDGRASNPIEHELPLLAPGQPRRRARSTLRYEEASDWIHDIFQEQDLFGREGSSDCDPLDRRTAPWFVWSWISTSEVFKYGLPPELGQARGLSILPAGNRSDVIRCGLSQYDYLESRCPSLTFIENSQILGDAGDSKIYINGLMFFVSPAILSFLKELRDPLYPIDIYLRYLCIGRQLTPSEDKVLLRNVIRIEGVIRSQAHRIYDANAMDIEPRDLGAASINPDGSITRISSVDYEFFQTCRSPQTVWSRYPSIINPKDNSRWTDATERENPRTRRLSLDTNWERSSMRDAHTRLRSQEPEPSARKWIHRELPVDVNALVDLPLFIWRRRLTSVLTLPRFEHSDETTTFTIATLLPALDSKAVVQCGLVRVSEVVAFTYIKNSLALSPSRLATIQINGLRYEIPEALEVLLRRIRSPKTPMNFYALPICTGRPHAKHLHVAQHHLALSDRTIDALKHVSMLGQREIEASRREEITECPDPRQHDRFMESLEDQYAICPDYIAQVGPPMHPSMSLVAPQQRMSFHAPLDAVAGDIRVVVLRLTAQEHDADVEAELHVIPARYSLFYALSYCWGNEKESKIIILNGQQFRVRKNLHDFLVFWRRYCIETEQQVPLWIDAISINQGPPEIERGEERAGIEHMAMWRREKEKSVREKSREIRRMDEIYKFAGQVLIWLGKDIEFPLIPADICLDAKRLTEWMLTLENKQAAVQALNHPYFRRAWCTQEVALARDARVIIGPNIISWDYLGAIMSPLTLSETVLYHSRIKGSKSLPLPPQRWDSRPDSVTGHAKAAVERLNHLHRMVRSARNNKQMSLLSLLVSTVHCESTFPVDKLYSLWSMAKDASSLLPDPNYSRTKSDVFTEFTRSWIEKYKRQDILSAIESHEDDERFDMPGWVPDWSSPKRTSSPLLDPMSFDDDFINVEDARLYDASAGFDLMSNISILDDIFTASYRFSDTRGISCGKIRFCSTATYQGGSVDDVVFLSLMSLTTETVPDQKALGNSFAAYRNFVRALASPDGSSGADEEHSDIDLTDQIIDDFIWAIVAGRTPDGKSYQSSPKLPYEIVRHEGKATGLLPRDYPLATEDQPWYRHIESIMTGRRIALTDQGHVGLVPVSARPGDEIGILSCCSVPLVFRNNWGIPARRILGDSYFKRMMRGEMVEEAGGEEELQADIIHCWLRNCGSTLEIPERIRGPRDRNLLSQEIARFADKPFNLGNRSGPPISRQSRPQGRVFTFW